MMSVPFSPTSSEPEPGSLTLGDAQRFVRGISPSPSYQVSFSVSAADCVVPGNS